MPIADFSLAGKVAIVTGASRGIGRAIALALAEHGADVALAAREPEPLEAARAEVEARGRRAVAIPTNVRKTEALEQLVAATRERLGRVDVLVNNAATNPFFGRIEDLDERAFDTILATNVKALHSLSVFARRAMLEHGDGGAIVNVSSIGGFRASDVIGAYSISKAAVNMLTQVHARSWGRDGIRVNAVAPGLVKTEFARALWESPELRQAAEAGAALGRIGLPEDVAGAVVYLAGPAASWITGQVLLVEGGTLI